jgi:Kef-type K+ transport system membrane component KefB
VRAAYGTSWRTALAVGVSMAHVGEFAFILLSMAWQLGIVSPQVYELLLGITALSLLTTPLIILLCARLLRASADGSYSPTHQHHHSSPKVSGLARKGEEGFEA